MVVRDIVVCLLDIANDPKASTLYSSKPTQAGFCDIRRSLAYLVDFLGYPT